MTDEDLVKNQRKDYKVSAFLTVLFLSGPVNMRASVEVRGIRFPGIAQI